MIYGGYDGQLCRLALQNPVIPEKWLKPVKTGEFSWNLAIFIKNMKKRLKSLKILTPTLKSLFCDFGVAIIAPET